MDDFTFILSDERENCYGYVVLTSGINISDFLNNSVALFDHDTALVIGRWDNVRKENSRLIGTLVFAEGNALAEEKKNLVQQRALSAVSIGFTVEEYTIMEINGQSVLVVTKCQLKECSLVAIPGNPNAVRKISELKVGDYMKFHFTPSGINPTQNMKQIFTTLGLAAAASETEAVAAIEKLKASEQTLATQVTTLTEQLKNLQEQAKKDKATSLVDGALSAKKITAQQKDQFMALAVADYDATKGVLDAMQAYQPINEQLNKDDKPNNNGGGNANNNGGGNTKNTNLGDKVGAYLLNKHKQ